MLDVSGYEQKVARLKPVSFAVVKKRTFATNDDVNLVLLVWCLWDRMLGYRKCHIETGTLPNGDGVLSRETGNASLALSKAYYFAARRITHLLFLYWRQCPHI